MSHRGIIRFALSLTELQNASLDLMEMATVTKGGTPRRIVNKQDMFLARLCEVAKTAVEADFISQTLNTLKGERE